MKSIVGQERAYAQHSRFLQDRSGFSSSTEWQNAQYAPS
jgi:hypothetical protein